MIPLEDSAALLLCAGLSRRFGPGNKLLAPVAGRALVAHAAALCASLPFAARIAIVPPGDGEICRLLAGFGFETVANPQPEEGKDSSIRLGLARGLEMRARAILVLLGDMPHVEEAHLRAICSAATDSRAAISQAGDWVSPPTLIPAALARRVLDRADRPVRAGLGDALRVAASPSLLVDYDRPEHFDSLSNGG
jgi:CTP:molybdopterin cytidylyltransferase MocA